VVYEITSVDYNDCFSVEEELEIGLACTPRDRERNREQFCWLKEIELGCYVELVPSGLTRPARFVRKRREREKERKATRRESLEGGGWETRMGTRTTDG
jgi:hypothetical protein